MNRIDPLDYLACPICLNSITRKKNDLFCSSCNIFYSQLHGSSYSFLNEKNYSQRDFKVIKEIEKFWGNGWDKRLGEDDHSHFSKNVEELKKYYHSRKKRPKFHSFGGLLDNEIHYDELKRMFDQFSSVNVRKNGTKWSQFPKIGKIIEKVRPKYFPPGFAGFGLGGNFITAIK
jgi:hypothetical protein